MLLNRFVASEGILGTGIAFNPSFIKRLRKQNKFSPEILPQNVDFFEVSSLDEFQMKQEEIDQWFPPLSQKKITAHIFGFRVGTKLGPQDEFIANVNRAISAVNPVFISEDLCQFRVLPTAIDASPILLTDETKKYCIDGLMKINAEVKVPFLLENPPISFILGEQDFLEWFANCLESSNSYCLIDVGHLFSWESITGESVLNRLKDFPLDRVMQLHLAQGMIDHSSKYYADLHGEVYSEKLYETLVFLLDNCKNLKGVALEYFNLCTALSTGLNDLLRVKDLVDRFLTAKNLA
jgi:uncharacterized protein (UPF0276 family)